MRVISIADVKEHMRDNEPHFNVHAICLMCKHKWIGVVHYATSLFTLECSKCKACDSFASIIPDEYLVANGVDDQSIRDKYE